MTYAEAIQFLYGLQVFGARPGLETTRQLSALAGHPQNELRFVHVAGTNGKGSTCAMLESIYRAAGLRVGLFTSPHLVSFRERIQVNRQLIGEADVVRLVAELKALLPADQSSSITLFEFVTVMALRYFAEQKCDLVILETGLGGRLDATNIVTPLASVITNISLDHQAWLGDTLAKIATEKAGVIKPGVPVVTTECGIEAFAVIERTARESTSPLTRVESHPPSILFPPRSVAPKLGEAGSSSLPGEHQRTNAALAVATVKVLQKTFPVGDEQIAAGLARVKWPGRLQLITRPNGQRVLLDGAHNIAGVETLRAAIRSEEVPTLILGMLGDKDWRPMCETLAPLAARILLVPVDSARTAKPEELAVVCRMANPRAEVLCMKNLTHALENAADDKFIVIAGSLYLIGAALVVLDTEFSASGDERGLNEWSGKAKTNSPR
jgi:dihydrofolate synthase / folylpolyglutamate synthase